MNHGIGGCSPVVAAWLRPPAGIFPPDARQDRLDEVVGGSPAAQRCACPLISARLRMAGLLTLHAAIAPFSGRRIGTGALDEMQSMWIPESTRVQLLR
jgi:hypothetical protein